jgi:hypothetical protein
MAFMRYPLRSITLPLMALLLVWPGVSSPAQAESAISRLNKQLQFRSQVYLPARMTVGQDTPITIQAPPGQQVRVYWSLAQQGLMLPNGQPLRVGTDAEFVEGVIPEKGVLTLNIPAFQRPLDAVYMDAALWQGSLENARPLPLMDATGRPANRNLLSVVEPVDARGATLMPAMPGMSPQLINQLNAFSEAKAGNTQKQLLLDEGTRDALLDQNPFMDIRQGVQQRPIP